MDILKHYINGQWIESNGTETLTVINPASEQSCGIIASGNEADVNAAVAAAKAAFPSFSQTSKEERIALLERILTGLAARKDDFAKAITEEMGAPAWLSNMRAVSYGRGAFLRSD